MSEIQIPFDHDAVERCYKRGGACICGLAELHLTVPALTERADAMEGIVRRYLAMDDGENHLGQRTPCDCDICIDARKALRPGGGA